MNILDQIILHKRKEVEEKKELFPVKLLEKSSYFQSPSVSLRHYLCRTDKIGIIAEIKRQSPSLGTINPHVDVERTSIGYMQAGASALSVLTDTRFFGGKNMDLTVARTFNYCPVLRKDFVLDAYQIIEAKSIGADAILLLANVLSKAQVKQFSDLAHQLGLEVLLEIHSEDELAYCSTDVDVIGVNNRDLKTFNVDLQQSLRLLDQLPSEVVKISESGIRDAEDLVVLKQAGFNGFLMGERFMKHSRPEKACLQFIMEVRKRLAEKGVQNEN